MPSIKLLNGTSTQINCTDIEQLIFDEKNNHYAVILKNQNVLPCSRDELWDLSQVCSGVVSNIFQP
jgi:hypothetical protein